MTEKKEELSFEQGLKNLEQIISQVEQGQIGLEDSIEKYEQGMKLIKHCRTILEQCEKRIETINDTPNEPRP
jgi:exodeoxyribonuclease VII small subunit